MPAFTDLEIAAIAYVRLLREVEGQREEDLRSDSVAALESAVDRLAAEAVRFVDRYRVFIEKAPATPE